MVCLPEQYTTYQYLVPDSAVCHNGNAAVLLQQHCSLYECNAGMRQPITPTPALQPQTSLLILYSYSAIDGIPLPPILVHPIRAKGFHKHNERAAGTTATIHRRTTINAIHTMPWYTRTVQQYILIAHMRTWYTHCTAVERAQQAGHSRCTAGKQQYE